MKKMLFILAAITLLITVIYAQSQNFFTLTVAHNLTMKSGSTLDVDGTADFSGTTTFSGTVTIPTVTAETALVPDAADGATIGTSALEWSDIYLADGGVIYFGADQDVTLTHVADAGLLLNSSRYLTFRDAALAIASSTDGQLDIDADGEVEIATVTLDINATTTDISGRINNGSGFWAGAPLPGSDPSVSYQFFEDFIGIPLVVTTNAFEGWKATGDASYVVASTAGDIGGTVTVTPVTGSNNEIYFQLGELGTETFVEYVASSNKESWTEFKFTTDAVTDSGNIFIGYAEEGSSQGNFINDDGNDFADLDIIGFVVWEANPDTLEFVYQTSGSAFVRDTVATIVAGTYVTAGFHFDGTNSLTYYIDGTSVAIVGLNASGFPDGEELAPIIAVKNGAADKTVTLDWIKFVVER